MTRVTVLVQNDAVPGLLRQGHASEAAQDLLRATNDLGVSLEPMHPGVADPELAGYFILDVPDEQSAQRVMDQLRACSAVEAVYVKPPEALP